MINTNLNDYHTDIVSLSMSVYMAINQYQYLLFMPLYNRQRL